jgi:hypothetical protein
MLMQEAQTFQFHFLSTWIMLQPFNPLLLQLILMRQLVILLLQNPGLPVLAGQSVQTLRTSQHNGRVSSQARQRGKSGNGSKQGTEHRLKKNTFLPFIDFFGVSVYCNWKFL